MILDTGCGCTGTQPQKKHILPKKAKGILCKTFVPVSSLSSSFRVFTAISRTAHVEESQLFRCTSIRSILPLPQTFLGLPVIMNLAFSSFLPLRSMRRSTSGHLCRQSFHTRILPICSSKSHEDDSKEPHDIPQSAVDWNSEWEKFSGSGMRSMAPKGREPVSKERLARQRALDDVRKVTSKLPSRQQLFADWRFWMAIILALSVFTAFVQSTNTAPGVGSI